MKRVGKVKTFAMASLAAVALAAPVAWAQTAGQEGQEKPRGERGFGKRGGHGRGGGHFGRGGFGLRGIELTEDQKARLQQLHQSFGERTRPLREQLRAKREEIRQANDGATFNEALVTQKLTEAAAVEARLMGEQFRLHQEVLSLLTAEQKAQLEQRRQERRARRGERRGAPQTQLQ